MLRSTLKYIDSPLRGLALLVVCVLAVSACRQEDPISVASKLNPKKMPTMTTKNVMTIISDSGIPQYRMVCPVWYVYDNVDTPKWILPQGPYLEKFDADYNIVFTVAADSAVNDRLAQRWYLYGNVEFNEYPDLLMLTPYLVWDQREQRIYSDSFIHIEQPDKIIEGYGFEGYTSSRGSLQSYELRRPTAVLPYNRDKFPGEGVGGMIPAIPAAQMQASQQKSSAAASSSEKQGEIE